MEYLASCSYVHRDLAARNCLVGDQQIIKISDFAKMKSCYNNDYYQVQKFSNFISIIFNFKIDKSQRTHTTTLVIKRSI